VLWAHLLGRLAALAVVAMVAYGWYWSVGYAIDQSQSCVAEPSPVVLHVPASTVAYARERGWPRELYRGDPLRWSVVALDRSEAARRVERRSRRFCPERRFRLEAR
jgi:hypothetical protein